MSTPSFAGRIDPAGSVSRSATLLSAICVPVGLKCGFGRPSLGAAYANSAPMIWRGAAFGGFRAAVFTGTGFACAGIVAAGNADTEIAMNATKAERRDMKSVTEEGHRTHGPASGNSYRRPRVPQQRSLIVSRARLATSSRYGSIRRPLMPADLPLVIGVRESDRAEHSAAREYRRPERCERGVGVQFVSGASVPAARCAQQRENLFLAELDERQFDDAAKGIRGEYFHVNFAPSILGQHVTAGTLIGYAATLGNGQTPSRSWKYSSNFDIAVSEGSDDNTVDYFAKLSGPALAA